MSKASDMAPAPLTYQDLVARYGKEMAFDFLLTVEKLAKIRDSVVEIDEEARLMRALEALDKAA